jgi:hypothetical protein
MVSISTQESMPHVATTHTKFYLWMSIACLFVAVGGFTPTYFLPISKGTLNPNAGVHFHGFLFFLWPLFLVLQSWLAVNNRVQRHRSLGLLGISLATLMPVAAILASINRAKIFSSGGAPQSFIDTFIGSVAIDISIFAFLVVIALIQIRKPETHRRLMMVATISLLGAALNRIYPIVAPVTAAAFLEHTRMELPILTADLLFIPLLAYDWNTSRKIHPAYIWSIGAVIILHVGRVPLYSSEFSGALGKFFWGFVG